jgi:uncharacterized protein
MPLIQPSTYVPAWPHGNAHAATVWPTLLRRVPAPPGRRERLDTPDGDFIDLDHWFVDNTAGTVVLCHGLEGNAQRQYMRGMGWAFARRGWRVAAYNYRGCSGQPNRGPRSYHSGATDDLRLVLDRVRERADGPLALVGFSLGGNLILKYLGEDPQAVCPKICAAVAISAPVDLSASADRLGERGNAIYSYRFLRKLRRKVRAMAHRHPDLIDVANISGARTLRDFDDLFTAPVHGFTDAADYYRRCSARQHLPAIQVPTLMLSARNDPFLAPSCFPVEEARNSEALHLEAPDCGGHVGFHQRGPEYWSEERAVGFVEGLSRG